MMTLSHLMTLGGKSCDDTGTPDDTGGTNFKSMGHMMTLGHMVTLQGSHAVTLGSPHDTRGNFEVMS